MAEFVEQAPPAARAALQEQDLSTAQMVAAFEMSTVPAVNLGRLAASAIRDLKPQAAFLHEQVVMADEWTDQGQRRRAIEELTPALADVMLVLTSVIEEISIDDLPEDEKVRLRWSQTLASIRERAGNWGALR